MFIPFQQIVSSIRAYTFNGKIVACVSNNPNCAIQHSMSSRCVAAMRSAHIDYVFGIRGSQCRDHVEYLVDLSRVKDRVEVTFEMMLDKLSNVTFTQKSVMDYVFGHDAVYLKQKASSKKQIWEALDKYREYSPIGWAKTLVFSRPVVFRYTLCPELFVLLTCFEKETLSYVRLLS